MKARYAGTIGLSALFALGCGGQSPPPKPLPAASSQTAAAQPPEDSTPADEPPPVDAGPATPAAASNPQSAPEEGTGNREQGTDGEAATDESQSPQPPAPSSTGKAGKTVRGLTNAVRRAVAKTLDDIKPAEPVTPPREPTAEDDPFPNGEPDDPAFPADEAKRNP